MGDVIGDLSSRRGRIDGTDLKAGIAHVRGFVPLSEMFGYATDLRSKPREEVFMLCSLIILKNCRKTYWIK